MRAPMIAAFALLAAGPALAADHYEFRAAEGGFLRLDRGTGAASFCSASGDGYACRPATGTELLGASPASEIEKRVAAMEERLRKLEGAPPRAQGATAEAPTDEQIDRAAGFVRKALKRLKELAEEIQRDDEADRQRL